MEFSSKYTLGFAIVLCLVLSLGVSAASVGLKSRIDGNKKLYEQLNVLRAAGIIAGDEKPPQDEVDKLFAQIEPLVIDRKTGAILDDDPLSVDPLRLAKDSATSEPMPTEHRNTQVASLPDKLKLYEVRIPGKEGIVLPIHGNGLWSTMYGFLALSADGQSVSGITYYDQKETPGLGGEVENPSWKAQWPGKRAFAEDGTTPLVEVVKAGMVVDPSYQVDGLSGATITTNGVTYMVRLWLGEHGYGPYLAQRGEANPGN